MGDNHGITNLGDAFALIRFLGYVIPFGGLIAPILIWQLKKEQFPDLDQHGKMVVNFIISMLVYSAVAFVLNPCFCRNRLGFGANGHRCCLPNYWSYQGE